MYYVQLNIKNRTIVPYFLLLKTKAGVKRITWVWDKGGRVRLRHNKNVGRGLCQVSSQSAAASDKKLKEVCISAYSIKSFPGAFKQ